MVHAVPLLTFYATGPVVGACLSHHTRRGDLFRNYQHAFVDEQRGSASEVAQILPNLRDGDVELAHLFPVRR